MSQKNLSNVIVSISGLLGLSLVGGLGYEVIKRNDYKKRQCERQSNQTWQTLVTHNDTNNNNEYTNLNWEHQWPCTTILLNHPDDPRTSISFQCDHIKTKMINGQFYIDGLQELLCTESNTQKSWQIFHQQSLMMSSNSVWHRLSVESTDLRSSLPSFDLYIFFTIDEESNFNWDVDSKIITNTIIEPQNKKKKVIRTKLNQDGSARIHTMKWKDESKTNEFIIKWVRDTKTNDIHIWHRPNTYDHYRYLRLDHDQITKDFEMIHVSRVAQSKTLIRWRSKLSWTEKNGGSINNINQHWHDYELNDKQIHSIVQPEILKETDDFVVKKWILDETRMILTMTAKTNETVQSFEKDQDLVIVTKNLKYSLNLQSRSGKRYEYEYILTV